MSPRIMVKRSDQNRGYNSFTNSIFSSKNWTAEILGVFLLALAIFALASLISYDPADRSLNTYSVRDISNHCGIIGAYFADIFIQNFGEASFLIPLFLAIIGLSLIYRKKSQRIALLSALSLIMLFTVSCLFSMILGKSLIYEGLKPGGVFGAIISSKAISYLNFFGAMLLFIALFIISASALSGVSLLEIGEFLGKLLSRIKLPQFKIPLDRSDHREKTSDIYPLKKEPEQKPITISKSRPPISEQIPSETEELEQSLAKEEESSKQPAPFMPQISYQESKSQKSNVEVRERKKPLPPTKFILPPVDILDDPPPKKEGIIEEMLYENASIIMRKLHNFGVEGSVTHIHPGPVVTRYEFEPAPGVKVAKVQSLADDLALALKAPVPPRIALIPGRSAIGIEVPNPYREIVYLKEIISSPIYQKNPSITKLGLGKDIEGNPFVIDITDMPHLLIAGATGSGKSVCLNTIMINLLLNATPDQVQLLLIDPKMLELSSYNDIPHLCNPVVVEPKQAAAALYWALGKMEERYSILASEGVRSIEHFNKLISERAKKERWSEEELKQILLPYIIIIIDELADLMMVASSEVETYIGRLAQMARAAGIHLIVATQRPSVDVITGVIKANFPCRVAFRVSSRVDSRTILDNIGAEKLLGKGDLLLLPPTTSKLIRLHGAYVSEAEINRVVDFLKEQNVSFTKEPIFNDATINSPELVNEDDDEFFDKAVELVVTSRHASISMLQRRFRIGYARAARLIDIMERKGIVGPFEGSKPREVLVDENYLTKK